MSMFWEALPNAQSLLNCREESPFTCARPAVKLIIEGLLFGRKFLALSAISGSLQPWLLRVIRSGFHCVSYPIIKWNSTHSQLPDVCFWNLFLASCAFIKYFTTARAEICSFCVELNADGWKRLHRCRVTIEKLWNYFNWWSRVEATAKGCGLGCWLNDLLACTCMKLIKSNCTKCHTPSNSHWMETKLNSKLQLN